jgi:hypothetical protein
LRYRNVLEELSILDAEDEDVTVRAYEDFLFIKREDNHLRFLELRRMQDREVLGFGQLLREKGFYVRGIVDVYGVQIHVPCNHKIFTRSRELELFHVLLYNINRHYETYKRY